MIVKLRCIDNGGSKYVTSGMEYDALADKNDIYVILGDSGYFSFIDFYDIADGGWEIVN